MGASTSAADFLPERRTLSTLARAAEDCKGCDLYRNATQTVFGEGRAGSRIMLVGEQPGDREDVEGHPFVGPAGRLLDRALEQAGIDRRDAYVTNVVKHFRFEPRGKRRIHRKPSAEQIRACRPWLEAELEAVAPQAGVFPGAPAGPAPARRPVQPPPAARGGGGGGGNPPPPPPPGAPTRQYSRSRPSAHQRPSIRHRPITSAISYRRPRQMNAEGIPASRST